MHASALRVLMVVGFVGNVLAFGSGVCRVVLCVCCRNARSMV